jgi:aldose 1-epimerase
MRSEIQDFGRLPDGTAIQQIHLSNDHGLTLSVITYGATITGITTPDRHGCLADVVLGFPDLAGYLGKQPYFGATVGRVAGRITGARFTLDGATYQLPVNNGANHLHGGLVGLSFRAWTLLGCEQRSDRLEVVLTCRSVDGDEGYPGNVDLRVTYWVTNDGEVGIGYEAVTDKATPLSLTNHAYFNLAGSGTILEHRLAIHADRYYPADSVSTLLGTLIPVDAANDLRQARRLAEVVPGIADQHGDLYLVRRSAAGDLVPTARLSDPHSGRVLEVSTSDTCVQFFAAKILSGALIGKGGQAYPRFGAVCLECEGYPDAANRPDFEDGIVRPGSPYHRTTVYRFTTD